MTDIASKDQNETEAAETAAPAQPELRIGVGALLGRLSASEAA